ncbi:MAG: serine/threonine protein kinase, partial [Planctomycetes bacterium]|nr:serine/threonine protein kinase [Planctomycetota bacterium]
MSRFEVISVLGKGGGGVVYRGWDHQRGCPVAIKTLAEPYSPDDAARFAREAEALVVLRHPHVVRALALLPGPPPQLIMELLPDGSLEDRLRAEGAQPIPRVVRWGVLLADTLAFVHARGFVHRDLKPANVLLDGDQLKLADFGLTRGDAAHTITQTGEVLGTPGYLAPEQALGQPVGPQTDVYGLGALLYALLGGQPPAGGASALETLRRVADGELTPLRRRRPDVPPWLERVVARCLATDPRDRY